jgi:hypothetical protein
LFITRSKSALSYGKVNQIQGDSFGFRRGVSSGSFLGTTTLGWDKDKFVFDIILHFDIKDGKVWIQQNWTDLLLDEELQKRGIERQDIVVGFLPPYAREQSGLATA